MSYLKDLIVTGASRFIGKMYVSELTGGVTGNYPVQNMTDTSASIKPNIFYIWGTMSSLSISLATPDDSNICNEYIFQFTSGSTATTLSLPNTVKWPSTLQIKANKTYQISIVNNVGGVINA